MDAYYRCTNLGKNLGCSVAIYGRGREIFTPPTYIVTLRRVRATIVLLGMQ